MDTIVSSQSKLEEPMAAQSKSPRKRRSAPQARGTARREKLVAAAIAVLDEVNVEDVSLADVAAEAGIPLGSIYHFFPGVHALFAEVARYFASIIDERLSRPYELVEGQQWSDVMAMAIDRAVTIYQQHPAYMQIILSGKAPAEVKLSDRENDSVIGEILCRGMAEHFEMPDIPNRNQVFFHAVEIADLMFMLSVSKHGHITADMAEEAKRASIAYLRVYLPGYLPPRRRIENE